MAVQAPSATSSAAPAKVEREQRRTAVGMVTSTKMQKTIVVSIDRTVRHAKFEKQMTRQTALKAHDEKGEARLGDLVEVTETRPLSKTKRWRLVRIVRKSQLATVTGALETKDVSKVKGGHKGKARDEKPAAPAKAESPAKGKEKK